jgi:hypothetical protein
MFSFCFAMGQDLPTKGKQMHNRVQIQIIPVTRDGEIHLIKLWLLVITQTREIANLEIKQCNMCVS